MDLHAVFVDLPFLTSISLSLAFTFILILYFKIRQKFPVRVTCWFCHEVSKVPYRNKNCWDCSSCEQYNGFTKDGDYNKTIPAQYDSSMNDYTGCQKSEFLRFSKQLCEKCNNNLQLKARMLAHFCPLNEANYDEEMKQYKDSLDKDYDICMNCQITVQLELQKQDALLLRKLRSYEQLPFECDVSNSVVEEKKSAFIMVGSSLIVKCERITVICLLYIVLRCTLYSLKTVCETELSWLQYDIEFPWILTDERINTVLQIIGYFTTLRSKVELLEKYRLHPVDFISVTLWTVTFLLQYMFSEFSSDMYLLYVNVANLVFAISSMHIKRRYRSYIKLRSSTDRKSKKTCKQQNNISSTPSKNAGNKNEDCFDDTLTKLEAFSLGTANPKQAKSGIFNSSCTTPEKTFTFPQKLSASRPLISPAKLNTMKFPKQKTEGLFNTNLTSPEKSHNTNCGLGISMEQHRQSGFNISTRSN